MMTSKRGLSMVTVFLVALLATTPVAALSPPPPQPDNFLLPALYEAFDGDNWVNNEGWLDPDVHWCDWHGVTCGEEFWPGFFDFARLDLSGNNLRGQFNEKLNELFQSGLTLPEDRLDLSDNHITGPMPIIPARTRDVGISGNQLSGPLPAAPFIPIIPGGGPLPFPIETLDLSNNQFSGTIPAAWRRSGDGLLHLKYLDLSDNQLEGEIEGAVRSMRSEPWPGWVEPDTGLWLADNDFSGVIDPAWFEELDLAGLNLCWTGLEIDDPELDEWIAKRHWGGSHHQCLNRERLALDPSISGTWYDIHRPGEGFSLMLLEDGMPLLYWFSHISNNRQLWLFNNGISKTTTARMRPLFRTRGEFSQGFSDVEFSLLGRGGLRLDRVGPALLHAEFRVGYSTSDLPMPEGTVIILPPPIPDIGFRADHYQLTRLAGSTCENQRSDQWISGIWYNPERNGEGFIVELNEDGRAIVYWFTYLPDGSGEQVWMIGEAGSVLLPSPPTGGFGLLFSPMLRPIGGGVGPDFDPQSVELTDWGELVVTFNADQQTGHISYHSMDGAFGIGEYPIERLARPLLVECEN